MILPEAAILQVKILIDLTCSGIKELTLGKTTDEGAGDRTPIVLLPKDALHSLLTSRPLLLICGPGVRFLRRRTPFPLGPLAGITDGGRTTDGVLAVVQGCSAHRRGPG